MRKQGQKWSKNKLCKIRNFKFLITVIEYYLSMERSQLFPSPDSLAHEFTFRDLGFLINFDETDSYMHFLTKACSMSGSES